MREKSRRRSDARKHAELRGKARKIYVAGGDDEGGTTLSSVECFDVATQAWTAAPEMGTARSGACAAVVGGHPSHRALYPSLAAPVPNLLSPVFPMGRAWTTCRGMRAFRSEEQGRQRGVASCDRYRRDAVGQDSASDEPFALQGQGGGRIVGRRFLRVFERLLVSG